ncbi:MAG: heavy metal-responsive transcriptional regulator [Gammaproteobacteria bacterium]|jgi:MerR family transcriptional regulator, copper efflux regulator
MIPMTIGQVAKETGVSVETIRFYEKEGLIDEPERNPSGYRQYPAAIVQRVVFIQRAKAVGFTLKEINELLSLQSKPDACCGDVLDKAFVKVEQIEAKINELQHMKDTLQKLTQQCVSHNQLDECPILDALYANVG